MEPCVNCFNPEAAEENACLRCRYPRHKLNPDAGRKTIGCTTCLNFSYERLGNEFCKECLSEFPKFLPADC